MRTKESKRNEEQLNEIKKIVETEKKEAEPNYVSIGLGLGLSLGTCFGVIFDKLSLGLGLGMCIGLAVSVVVAYKNVKVDDEKTEDAKEEIEEK